MRKDSKLKSVKEVFEFAKANPGKLKVGLVGPNSGHHLMFLDVKGKYDFPVTEIFYKGAADQNAALLGGEIDVMFGNLNDVMRSLEEMVVLGLAAEKRNDFLPEVATLKEQGYDVVSDIRRAFVAPKAIDKAQLDFLRATFKKISEDRGSADGIHGWRCLCRLRQAAERVCQGCPRKGRPAEVVPLHVPGRAPLPGTPGASDDGIHSPRHRALV